MITAEGCRQRRQRFLDRLQPTQPLLLSHPYHLRYLANVYVDPLSLSMECTVLLLLQPDGISKLFYDNRLPKRTVERCYVDERVVLPWYDGLSPGQGPRGVRLREVVATCGGRIHDALDDDQAEVIHTLLADLRRSKDADELAVMRECMRVTAKGHEWALNHLRAGMTELDVYAGVSGACQKAAGEWAVVYGDFVVCTGASHRGGPPTTRVLNDGDLFILDFSVVIQGYRSDFTNTLVVGGKPTDEQKRLMSLCQQALKAGEERLCAGVLCQDVYDAVHGVFADAGVADAFPHHAGHGLGVSHPEAPFIVKHSTETLRAGDIITLEPGLYLDKLGGMRIEHNYVITDQGYERLSHHHIGLT